MDTTEPQQRNLLTVQQVAHFWNCRSGDVVSLIERGQLPAIRIGERLYRVAAKDVDGFQDGGGTTESVQSLYVLECGEFIKIGHAYDVEHRVKTMETGNPYPIKVLLARFGDGERLERQLHKRFARHRHRHEWFRMEGELADWIKEGCPL
jgi:excisionase family DNA binding protein